MELSEIVKELDEKLEITKTEKREKILYIRCQRKPETAKCPACGTESNKIHSKYRREIADLPISQYKVKLMIEVKKYTCSNPKCSRKRFAEELPFVGERCKRTKRLDEYIREIGLRNSSVEAEKIVRKTHADISSNTILRLIKKSNERAEV